MSQRARLLSEILNAGWFVRHYSRPNAAARIRRQQAYQRMGAAVVAALASNDPEPVLAAVAAALAGVTAKPWADDPPPTCASPATD